MFVLPIGGGDMPVVISILNSLTGSRRSADRIRSSQSDAGCGGVLVGASGHLLTLSHEHGDEQSVANVLFGAFGATSDQGARCDGSQQDGAADYCRGHGNRARVRAERCDRAGYGLAVAEAQHTVRELRPISRSAAWT
jgi:NAD(P) transhydrogenase subunit beta